MIDCTVRLVDLPVTVRGLVSEDETGWPNVYINARLSREMQREALRHELDHIAEDDLYNTRPIEAVENKRRSAP